jgi:hypothetical protein
MNYEEKIQKWAYILNGWAWLNKYFTNRFVFDQYYRLDPTLDFYNFSAQNGPLSLSKCNSFDFELDIYFAIKKIKRKRL